MFRLVCVAVLALCAQAVSIQVVFENIGQSGISILAGGVKEGPGVEIADDNEGKEYFKAFIKKGEKAGEYARLGARFLIRGTDSKKGPGFRAALQIQKGQVLNGDDYPYRIVVTNIANEDKARSIELVHRGSEGADSKEYQWIDPGKTLQQVTHGSSFNAFDLRAHDHSPVVKFTLYDYKHEL
jgi:hypothetical protein